MDPKMKLAAVGTGEHSAEIFAKLLIVGREHFDGDLDALLIMAVIEGCSASSREPDEIDTGRSRQVVASKALKSTRVNITSLAEISGIPRETVRRKVNHLIERGWVIRDNEQILLAPHGRPEKARPVVKLIGQYITRMKKLSG